MKPIIVGATALVLAGSTGFLAAATLNAGNQQPTKTVTINVGTGAQGPKGDPGPPGPAGPPGPNGAETCPGGYTFQAILLNHPGGQTQLAACVKG